MSDLILNSLEIRNFRGFQHLQIERLGRVNLIVGKNNIGKTSLLEALQLYARRGSPALIWELLAMRDENLYSNPQPNRSVNMQDWRMGENRLVPLRYLYYGREALDTYSDPIQIGPMGNSDEMLSITVRWYVEHQDASGAIRYNPLQPDEYKSVDNAVPRFTIRIGTQPERSFSLIPPIYPGKEIDDILCVIRAADGMSKEQTANLWDGIALTELEKDVLSALRIVAPGIEGLSLVGDPRFVLGRDQQRERVPIVKVADVDEPLPMRSLGNGMMRTLGIVLALVNARDGLLLIDEFENGIHYGVLPELWELIFQAASRLNVQVFAAAHSWDCVEAFQKAASGSKQGEGLLVRLSLKKDNIVATLFDERRLGIATREHIEVR